MLDDGQHVIDNGGIDGDACDGFLQLREVGAAEHAGSGFAVMAAGLADNLAFALCIGIADAQAHQKAIELRFGQRIRAMMFGRILRGDHHEGFGQRQGAAFNGDLLLIHGFEQRRLGLGRGAIDFVGQQEIGEDGAGLEFELLGRACKQ